MMTPDPRAGTSRRPAPVRSSITSRLRPILLFATVASMLLVPVTSAEDSVGVTPATVMFEDTPLLPGGVTKAVLDFHQDYGQPVDVTIDTVAVNGPWEDASAWLRVDSPEQMVLDPGVHRVTVFVETPETAANGLYKGGVEFTVSPPDGSDYEGSGATARASVTAVIGGVVDREGQLKQVAVLDEPEILPAEIGGALQVIVPMANTGNVDVKPQVHLSIADKKQTRNITEHEFAGVVISPGHADSYRFRLDPVGLPVGQYWGTVSVHLDDEPLGTWPAQTFDVLEVGALARVAELRQIYVEGNGTTATTGSILRLGAVVLNVGEGDLVARFHGEVWRDGQFVDTLESAPRAIATGDTGILRMVYTPDEPGAHEFKGRVEYSSKVTEEKSVRVAVGSEGRAVPATPFGMGATAIVVAFAAVALNGRRRVS